MKKILIAASVVGAAAAGAILYARKRNRVADGAEEVKDSLKDAYREMDRHIQRTERTTENALS
jgi:hypothetical protein